jgi:hypothetical protein
MLNMLWINNLPLDFFFGISLSEKPWPDGLALALETPGPGQSHQEAVILARPILAWLGLAHGLRPGQAHHY